MNHLSFSPSVLLCFLQAHGERKKGKKARRYTCRVLLYSPYTITSLTAIVMRYDSEMRMFITLELRSYHSAEPNPTKLLTHSVNDTKSTPSMNSAGARIHVIWQALVRLLSYAIHVSTRGGEGCATHGAEAFASSANDSFTLRTFGSGTKATKKTTTTANVISETSELN